MAQDRLRDWEEPIDSFPHNIFNLGMHNPGRYCGFDTMKVVNPTTLDIQHTSTGMEYKDETNVVRGPFGMVLTPQGVLVKEDADITALVVNNNAGNGVRRYDAVVLNHDYVVVTGGNAATYSIIQGPIGVELKPNLVDPFKQTLIGVIEFQPGGDLTTAVWYPAKCPDSGDGEDARLVDPNVFKAIQMYNKSAGNYSALTGTHPNGTDFMYYMELLTDGNTYEINPPADIELDAIRIKDLFPQQGTRIVLYINPKTTLRGNYIARSNNPAINPFYAKGYRGIQINSGMGTGTITYGNASVSPVIKPLNAPNEPWAVELIFINDVWVVMSIGGVKPVAAIQSGMIVEWHGNIWANFDATGLGINLMTGYALCNGNHGTPDDRGKITVQATDVPAAGRPDLSNDASIIAAGLNPNEYYQIPWGAQQGERGFYILQNNLPNFNLPVTDPGHQHSWAQATYTETGTGRIASGGAGVFDGNVGVTTGFATTGIIVNSGGLDEYLIHKPPLIGRAKVMKL